MSEAPPTLPSRFVVQGLIGRGGMATVWLADDSLAREQVAVKVLLPHLRHDELIVERFRREMAAVRRVGSPHIVAIHDLIETEEVLALVLDYHPGTDLKRLIRRHGALSIERGLGITRQVLQGLQAAHLQGVVHRDIKPHNILLDEQGDAKIADFGLARVDDLVGVTTHTMTLGTPEYLAPELLSSALVDGRADLYSLGVSLYEALTGKLPFRATSPMMLMRMHQEAAVPDPRRLVAGLPAWLAQLIQRAMAKDPEERFATAAEMLQVIDDPDHSGVGEALAPITAGSCRACGAPLLPQVPACVECGAEPLQLRQLPRGGRRVFIEPISWLRPDALTFEQKYKVVAELVDLGATLQRDPEALELRLRNLPVVVADRLDPDSAAQLAELLIRAGVPAQPGRGGWRDRLRYLRQLVRPSYWAVTLTSAAVLGISVLLPPLAPGVFWLQVWGGALALTLVLSARDMAMRLPPLAQFGPGTSAGTVGDPLLARVASTLRGIHSPRLRALVRRLVGRGLELRLRLAEDEALRAELATEVDHSLESALQPAHETGLLEDGLAAHDLGDLTEHLQILDERIAAAPDVETTEPLIEAKLELRQRLEQADQAQQQLVLNTSRLLGAQARLSTLLVEVRRRSEGAESGPELSTILVELNDELAAQRELDNELEASAAEHSGVSDEGPD